MDPKLPTESKTIIVNVLTGILLLINQFSGIVPPEYSNYVAIAVTVINVVLRFLTTSPIALSRKQ